MGIFINQALFGALNQFKNGDPSAIDNLKLAIAKGANVNAYGWGHGLTPLLRAI